MNLEHLLQFTAFTNEFRKVERKEYFTDTSRMESDGEHSFQLAVVAWYLANDLKLHLDLEKAFKYCLAHDLVETYAGDTPVLDVDGLATKKQREEQSMRRIHDEFGQKFPELTAIIEAYETRADPESRFVHALDKLLPAINVFLDHGRTWRELYAGLEIGQALEQKQAVIEDDTISQLLDEVARRLQERCPDLFPSDSSPRRRL